MYATSYGVSVDIKGYSLEEMLKIEREIALNDFQNSSRKISTIGKRSEPEIQVEWDSDSIVHGLILGRVETDVERYADFHSEPVPFLKTTAEDAMNEAIRTTLSLYDCQVANWILRPDFCY